MVTINGQRALAIVAGAALVPLVAQALVRFSQWSRDPTANIPSTTPARRAVHTPVTTLPILHNLLDFVRHEHDLFDWITDLCEAAAGAPVRLRLPGQAPWLLLSTPEAFEEVCKTQFAHFPKGEHIGDVLRDLIGDGIFGVDGERWRRQRKAACSLFTQRALRESMTRAVQKHTTRLQAILAHHAASGAPIDLPKLLRHFTMDVFGEIGFGLELGCLNVELTEHPFQQAFDSAQRALVLRFVRPTWFWKLQRWLGLGPEGRLQRDLKVIDALVFDIIDKSLAQRRQQQQQPQQQSRPRDLVSIFLASDPEAINANPRFLRDMVLCFLLAARDTTAQTLSWFFRSLSDHPEAAQRLRDELQAVLPRLCTPGTGDNAIDNDARPPAPGTMEEVQQLVHLEAALKETLRLYPSAPMGSKLATRDTMLTDGTFIPRGTTVVLSAYALGRMPHVWGPRARAFDPTRWLDPAAPGALRVVPPHAFPAFHVGPRICLGMHLAMLEMQIVAASVLGQWALELVPGQTIAYDLSLTLAVRGEMLVRVRPSGAAPDVIGAGGQEQPPPALLQ